jgi:hypothetical protein
MAGLISLVPCEKCKLGCLLYVTLNMRNIPCHSHDFPARFFLDRALPHVLLAPFFLDRALLLPHVEFGRHTKLIRVSVNHRVMWMFLTRHLRNRGEQWPSYIWIGHEKLFIKYGPPPNDNIEEV